MAFYILPEAGAPPVHVLSPKIHYLSKLASPELDYPLTGELFYHHGPPPTGNFSGRIIIYQTPKFIYKEKVLDKMADSNCKAIIFVFRSNSDYPGIGAYTKIRPSGSSNKFPVFEITEKQNKSLNAWYLNQTSGVHVIFYGDEPNPWDRVYNVFVPIFANLLLVFTAIILFIGVYKLVLIIYEKGFQLSIPQSVLWLNVICMAIRATWLITNPWAAYDASPFAWVQIGMTLPFAFCGSGAILITLYWHEMIIRTGPQINTFLGKMLIPFLVVCVLMFALEIGSIVVRSNAAVVPIMVFLDGGLYAVITLTLLIFFIVTKIRLNKEFAKLNKSLNMGKGKKLGIASNIVVEMGCVMVIWLIGLIFLGASPYFYIPKGYMAIWTILMVCLNLMCLLQILLIRAPPRPWKWILCGLFTENPQHMLSTKGGSSLTSVTVVSASSTSKGPIESETSPRG
jgi:hypothetical protein